MGQVYSGGLLVEMTELTDEGVGVANGQAGTCCNSLVRKARVSPLSLSQKMVRRITKDAVQPNELRDAAFFRVIQSIPKGKVATYGEVAAAAGYPLYHRAVARLLRSTPAHVLPWQRVVGAGGEIKLPYEAGAEQRLLLQMEGVGFLGRRVNLAVHRHEFRVWELE